jgi:hypothetical protein
VRIRIPKLNYEEYLGGGGEEGKEASKFINIIVTITNIIINVIIIKFGSVQKTN